MERAIPRIVGTYYGAKALYGEGKRLVNYFTPRRAPYRGHKFARTQRLKSRSRVRSWERRMPRWSMNRPMTAAFRRKIRSGYYEKSYAGRGYHAKRRQSRARRQSYPRATRGRRPRGKKRYSVHRIRMYPLGQPQTKTIKLKIMIQCAFKTLQDSFVAFNFRPADFRKPFQGMSLTTTANGMYTGVSTGIWVDRQTGTPAVTQQLAQPQGLDRWMKTGAATPGFYAKSIVKGSKITIKLNPTATDDTSNKFQAGFTKLWPNASDQGSLVSRVYKNVAQAETDDAVTTRLYYPKKFALEPSGGVPSKTWVFKYSQPKYQRRIARYNPGGNILNWYGTFDAAPAVNPNAWFILSDTSFPVTDTFVQFQVTCEYTVQLKDLEAIDRSSF